MTIDCTFLTEKKIHCLRVKEIAIVISFLFLFFSTISLSVLLNYDIFPPFSLRELGIESKTNIPAGKMDGQTIGVFRVPSNYQGGTIEKFEPGAPCGHQKRPPALPPILPLNAIWGNCESATDQRCFRNCFFFFTLLTIAINNDFL